MRGEIFLSFKACDALFQKLTIQIKTDRCNVTALLGAEQVARPANFQSRIAI